MENRLKKSILTSYLIGAPIGLLTIGLTIWIPIILSGEGIFSIALMGAYGYPIIGLILSFLIALGIGGKIAYDDTLKRKSLILTSFRYSLIVNLIIWITFCLILLITSADDKYLKMIPAVIALIICTLMTTLTLGLMIVFIIKRMNNKPID
jgi:hypothetical protein